MLFLPSYNISMVAGHVCVQTLNTITIPALWLQGGAEEGKEATRKNSKTVECPYLGSTLQPNLNMANTVLFIDDPLTELYPQYPIASPPSM